MDAAITDALIAQVYSAAAGRLPWQTALDTVARACDAWAVQLLAIDKRTGVAMFSHYGGADRAEEHLAYLRTYQHTDPRVPMHRLSRGLGLEAADD